MELVRKLSKMGQLLFEWPLIRLDISVSFRLCGSVCVCVCVYVCGCVCVGERERDCVCVCVMGGSYVCGFQFLWVSVRVSIRDGKTSIVAKMLFRCLRALSKYWARTMKIHFQNSRMIFLNTFWWSFYVWSL